MAVFLVIPFVASRSAAGRDSLLVAAGSKIGRIPEKCVTRSGYGGTRDGSQRIICRPAVPLTVAAGSSLYRGSAVRFSGLISPILRNLPVRSPGNVRSGVGGEEKCVQEGGDRRSSPRSLRADRGACLYKGQWHDPADAVVQNGEDD